QKVILFFSQHKRDWALVSARLCLLKSRDLGVRGQAAALPCDDTRAGKIVQTDVVALPAQLR
ncbi:MAG TPA: hypothetical protein VF866_08820, partial [Xanthobacteraceae bacterium]